VFTTPDFNKTEGTVCATRPFFVNGSLVEGLSMRFEAGEMVEFSAKAGAEAFRAHINTDIGAKRLGEVALVGIDSPVFQSGLVFEEILFDENAACHIAIGAGFKFCIAESERLNAEELEKTGCNDSAVHTDIMISSEQVSVRALLKNASELELIRDGKWVL
ncbi:MAG: aminopeptidase, partial [Bdellovibrionales bacterium]|nr:aminopeptidase [Bdellovibrionales bacterium]